MRVFYDLEFIERGPDVPMQLVSVGMVRDDGDELYLVNSDVRLLDLWRIPWLMDNVVPHLPIRFEAQSVGQAIMEWDTTHPDYDKIRTRDEIRDAVYDFVIGGLATESVKDPELWAYYGAYGHVILAQLFGSMAELPAGFPMMTMDLVQEAISRGLRSGIPVQEEGEHHALADARWVKRAVEWMQRPRIAVP